jgi:hypothetical protein
MQDLKERIRQYSDISETDIFKFLFHYWGFEFSEQPLKLIVGSYEKSSKPDKNGNEFGFFQEVRSVKGDILYYPFRLGLVSLFTMHKQNISSSDYYLVDVRLNNKPTRDKLGNPFALSLANYVFGKPKNTFLDLVNKEKFIKDIFNKRGATADDAGLISRAISKLAGDMYSDLSERFVFELLQNADDMPKDQNGVNVKLHLLENNILFIHDGLPFSKEDIKAITDIGNSTKKKNPSQTGYKGIGFKIVFQESENVLIKSGGFSFSFDKNHPYYDALKRNTYAGLTNDEIPWQLKPIWTEKYRYDKEIQDNSEFMNSNTDVAIAINTSRVGQFKTDIVSLIQEPRFILFLRNIKSIKIAGLNTPLEITKTKSEKYISLKSNNEHLSDWLTFDDIGIKISEEVRDAIVSDKSVPPKLKEINSTKLNFICQIIDGQIAAISPEESYLFTYLPTDVKDYKFPFLVNADFLTTANRQSIHVKNKWNLFLFEEIGKNCLKWIAEIANSPYKSSAYNLLPNSDTSINDQPWEAFTEGYAKAIDETEFLLSASGKLVKLKDISVDTTGFSKFVDSLTFKTLLNIESELISNEITDINPVLSTIAKFNLGKIIRIPDLIQSISNENFSNWLRNPNNNIIFLKFLSDNNLLEIFSSHELYLSKDLNLLTSKEILSDLGPDESELIWLNFSKLLHPYISSKLPEISLKLKQYEPISFINEIICQEKKNEIILGLNNDSISFDDFYNYIAKYASDPLFPVAEIKQFPLQTLEATLPEWSGQIFFDTSSLSKLLTEKALPDGSYYLLDDNWNRNPDLKKLAELLGVYNFLETEPFHFLQTIITTNKEAINRFYLTQTIINANASLWSFILSAFKNLSDPQKESIADIIKTFPVLSKNNVCKELQTLYLPSEYTDNDALETLSLQFQNSNIDFVSADYLKDSSIDKNELRSLFKKLDVKRDTKDFLQHTLIPNLDQISADLFIPVTRLLYENKESEPIIIAVIQNSHFKLKTKEGEFKSINECLVGSPYIDKTQIPNSLHSVPLINQISEEYSSSHLDAWQRFFSEKLKVSELKNKTEIIGLKLKYIADNIHLFQFEEVSVSLLRDIYLLYKSEELSLSNTNLNYLKIIPLLCKGENNSNFHTPSAIHFSSDYNPTFDFENIFGLECGVTFLSEKYKFEDGKELIKFFEQIGITQHFDQNRHSAICQNIQTADGQMKPASQLFKYELKKYVGDSNVSNEDLSKFSYNGRTLEDELKFKSKLDVASILNYINNNEPNKNVLKDLITKLLSVYIPNKDSNLINSFIKQGKLLTTAKSYNSITNLHLIDESIRSGIRENEYLIDPLFNKQEQDRDRYLKLFNIKNLKIEDFNPHYENAVADYEFTKRVNDRLLFLAFDSDSENYLEIEKAFKEKFGQWKIKKCSKISLKYPATESKIIKEDSKTFEIVNEKVIYYIGSWFDPRVNPVLVDCLSKNVLGLYKQRAFLQDMLLNDPIAIIEDFENKGRVVPKELKRRFNFSPVQNQPLSYQNHIEEIPISDDTKSDISKPDEVKKDDSKKDESNSKFIEDVKNFISDLEDSEWSEFIPELKSLLELSVAQPKERQKLFNLIAKLKLAKERNIQFDIADKDYNHLEKDDEKYFVHSARGAFAYIHPNEILQMRNKGYKMALDFSTKSRIKIYHTAEEILELNTNHILAYQYEKTMEDLFSFCEANRDANKHLLIIDKDNSGEKSKALLKLLNIEDDYQ